MLRPVSMSKNIYVKYQYRYMIHKVNMGTLIGEENPKQRIEEGILNDQTVSKAN